MRHLMTTFMNRRHVGQAGHKFFLAAVSSMPSNLVLLFLQKECGSFTNVAKRAVELIRS